jgi:hypothetical protein
MDELERAKPYYGNEFKVLKKNCFGEEGGGRAPELHGKHFLF